jgi:hypothetical protein
MTIYARRRPEVGSYAAIMSLLFQSAASWMTSPDDLIEEFAQASDSADGSLSGSGRNAVSSSVGVRPRIGIGHPTSLPGESTAVGVLGGIRRRGESCGRLSATSATPNSLIRIATACAQHRLATFRGAVDPVVGFNLFTVGRFHGTYPRSRDAYYRISRTRRLGVLLHS